ncbi:hypothetical protein QEG73_10670 [Chitinophagaceae bacterium 26-R-25]|nr:hypothetical protein [Chitinophagaceae bacterium 26-R-25]
MKRQKLVLLLLTVFCITEKNVWAQSKTSQSSKVEPFVVNDNVKEIIVVFKTHFDIGYTRKHYN